jgi:aldehyde dehydrogenase
MRRAARENAQLLAREAWEETGLGRLEEKIQKNLLNADKVPGTEVLVPRKVRNSGRGDESSGQRADSDCI